MINTKISTCTCVNIVTRKNDDRAQTSLKVLIDRKLITFVTKALQVNYKQGDPAKVFMIMSMARLRHRRLPESTLAGLQSWGSR